MMINVPVNERSAYENQVIHDCTDLESGPNWDFYTNNPKFTPDAVAERLLAKMINFTQNAPERNAFGIINLFRLLEGMARIKDKWIDINKCDFTHPRIVNQDHRFLELPWLVQYLSTLDEEHQVSRYFQAAREYILHLLKNYSDHADFKTSLCRMMHYLGHLHKLMPKETLAKYQLTTENQPSRRA